MSATRKAAYLTADITFGSDADSKPVHKVEREKPENLRGTYTRPELYPPNGARQNPVVDSKRNE